MRSYNKLIQIIKYNEEMLTYILIWLYHNGNDDHKQYVAILQWDLQHRNIDIFRLN